MKTRLVVLLLPIAVLVIFFVACSESDSPDSVESKTTGPPSWEVVPGWLKPPAGMDTIGGQHGDVAVDSEGKVYVSLTGGLRAGVQVYDADGNYLRNLPDAPADFHGFVIRRGVDDAEHLYGPRLSTGETLKMTLDGEIVLTIPADAIPKEHWKEHPKTKKAGLRLTACDVAPNGDIFVTDGYSSDLIHRFDREGNYLATFGGKGEPFLFETLHKIAVDTRFDPPRIVGVSRTDGRVVHVGMDGEWIGNVATDLLMPAALVVHDDLLAVGEIKGRVTMLDKEGNIVAQFGANDHLDQAPSNKVEPATWQAGVLYTPHGVAFDGSGNLYVSEFSVFGRVQRFDSVVSGLAAR